MEYFVNVSLKLYNVNGRLVYENNEITETDVIWDGRDSNNEFVFPGIYYYILIADGAKFKGELMIKR